LVDGTQRYELFECGIYAAAAEMALKESTDLLSGQAAVGRVDGFQDPVGGVVTGGCAEEERGAGGTVAFYQRWSSEPTRLLKGTFSFLSARPPCLR
jgi:hypothetical protein